MTLTTAAAGVPQVTLYRYDPQGQLVLEVAGTAVQAPGIAVSPGRVLVRYIWQDDVPVAVIWPPMTPGNPGASTDRVVHLIDDHLNTPRRATDAQGVVVWTWQGEAFGADPPDEDADRDGRQTVINLRFPGQYFDAESGLHYNWSYLKSGAKIKTTACGLVHFAEDDPDLELVSSAANFGQGLESDLPDRDPS